MAARRSRINLHGANRWAPSVSSTRPPCMLFALGRKRIGPSFARRSKFELAHPLTTCLCFSCYVWRRFAGICRPEPAHTSAPVDKLPLNRMPSTSETGFKHWLRAAAPRTRSGSDQDSCLAGTKITSASLDRRPAVTKKSRRKRWRGFHCDRIRTSHGPHDMTINPDLHNVARESVGRETTVPP